MDRIDTDMDKLDAAVQLYERLLNGIVLFEFKKNDGSIRKAIGTLNKELIPPKKEDFENLANIAMESLKVILMEDNTLFEKGCNDLAIKINKFFTKPIKKEKAVSPNTQSYYDFEAQSWRSYNINSIHKITYFK